MNTIDNRLSRLGALLAIGSLISALALPLTAVGKTEKVTICHATGQAGTDHYVELNLAYSAAYGNAGHLYEDGTARAGHEGDYEGPCRVTTTPPTTTPPTTTPPTTTPPTTTTPTTTVDEVASNSVTTTTTTVPETMTTTVAPEDDDSVAVAATDNSGTTGGQDAEVAAIETLPYTGMDRSLLVPASLLLMAGALLVSITGGFGQAAGAHAAGVDGRFGLGFYRGRHESSRWVR